MDIYTQMLDDEAATLSPDDEDYEEKLLDVARSFRTFSVSFIVKTSFPSIVTRLRKQTA